MNFTMLPISHGDVSIEVLSPANRNVPMAQVYKENGRLSLGPTYR
jgi:hypothetical protein